MRRRAARLRCRPLYVRRWGQAEVLVGLTGRAVADDTGGVDDRPRNSALAGQDLDPLTT